MNDIRIAIQPGQIVFLPDTPAVIPDKPQPLKKMNWAPLIELCEQYLAFIDNDAEYSEDNDYDHHIFEAAMGAVYGERVWKYVNTRQQ